MNPVSVTSASHVMFPPRRHQRRNERWQRFMSAHAASRRSEDDASPPWLPEPRRKHSNPSAPRYRRAPAG